MSWLKQRSRRKGEQTAVSLAAGFREQAGLFLEVADFVEHSEVKGLSFETTYGRTKALRYLIAWCEERGITSWSDITRRVLEQYQRQLFYYRKKDGRPLTLETQAVRLTSLMAFFSWLVKTERLPSNPAADLELPKQAKRLPRDVLTASEVELVLLQPDVNDPLGVRARAILETLYSTGMRRMELVALGVYDVDWQRETAHIRSGKGKKERIVPIGERALLWVRRYLDDVRPLLLAGRSEPALFLTINGEPMRRQTVSDLVTKCIEAAGINKAGSAHVLRHTAATLMLENGADIRFIQAMLGHEKLSSTEIYTKVTIEKLKEVHAATHPARFAPPSTSE